jgi:hypothetical protein
MSVLVGFVISRSRNRNIRHLVMTTEGLFELACPSSRWSRGLPRLRCYA